MNMCQDVGRLLTKTPNNTKEFAAEEALLHKGESYGRDK